MCGRSSRSFESRKVVKAGYIDLRFMSFVVAVLSGVDARCELKQKPAQQKRTTRWEYCDGRLCGSDCAPATNNNKNTLVVQLINGSQSSQKGESDVEQSGLGWRRRIAH